MPNSCPRCGAPVTRKYWPPPLCGQCARVDRLADIDEGGRPQDRSRDRAEQHAGWTDA